MSTVDLSALVALLEEVEAGVLQSPAARWLSEGGSLDEMDTEDVLLAIEAARRMTKIDRLIEAKSSSEKTIKKAAAKAIHSLKTPSPLLHYNCRCKCRWRPRRCSSACTSR